MKTLHLVAGLVPWLMTLAAAGASPGWESQTNTVREGDYFAGHADRIGPVHIWLQTENGEAWGRAFVPGRRERDHISGTRSAGGAWLLTLDGRPITPADWRAFGARHSNPGGVIVTHEGELRKTTNGFLAGRLEGNPPAFVGEWLAADQRTRLPVRLSRVANRCVVTLTTGVRTSRGEFAAYHTARSAYPVFPPTNRFWRELNGLLARASRKETGDAALAVRQTASAQADAVRLSQGAVMTLCETSIERMIDFASPHAVSVWEKRYQYWGGMHGGLGLCASCCARTARHDGSIFSPRAAVLVCV